MDIVRHNWLVLGSESPNIFCFVLFGTIRHRETSGVFQKNLRAERLAGRPQHGHCLTQLMARLKFKESPIIFDFV
jgi:hypothetical protein